MSAVSIRDLVAGYGSTRILHGLTLEIASGEAVALFGRNGVGKSTLLRSVLGFLPARGEVTLLGSRVTGWSTHRRIRLGVAYAPQERTLFAELTVRENLSFAMRGPRSASRLAELLEIFPRLGERVQQRAGTLSGGERKMLLLVRALMVRAPLVILDEIVEGVQPNLVHEFRTILARERERGTTLVLVEQNLEFALPLADRYVVMAGGRFVDDGDVDDESRGVLQRHLTL